MDVTTTNFDPLLEMLRPGAFWVCLAVLAATFAALLGDGIIRAAIWLAGLPERRRRARLELLRQIIRDWNRPEE